MLTYQLRMYLLLQIIFEKISGENTFQFESRLGCNLRLFFFGLDYTLVLNK